MNKVENLPQTMLSADIEKSVLASAAMNDKNLALMCQQLDVTDFSVAQFQNIFFLLKEINKESVPISTQIICEKAKASNALEGIGGMQQLLSVLTSHAMSCEISSYIEFLKERSCRRKVLHVLNSAIRNISEFDRPVALAMESIRENFYLIENKIASTDIISLKTVFESGINGTSFLNEYELKQERRKRGEATSGISTGFPSVDGLIGGLEEGNLILLAARPGMGKTTLALNIYEDIVYKQKIPALFMPLEMSTLDILEKLISSHCKIQYKNLRDSTISAMDFQEIVSFVSEQNTGYVTEKNRFTIPQIRTAAMRAKEAYGIKALFIDYLQLLKGSSRTKNESKYQEISEISMELKNLARELKIPIICLSQLSRKVEERQDQIPQLSDLRDSGSLEADADIVMFLYRHDHKNKDVAPGISSLIIAKNRRGVTGRVSLQHNFGTSSFSPSSYNS